ncbi:MAG: hypothetical protein J0I09_11235 [Sphingobacteriia bacterium]|nr:hypothetical protein [Sphingobacteriia bacterium]
MKLTINRICIVVSMLPVLLAACIYNNIRQEVYTKISGSNGMLVSRNVFMLLLIILAFAGYYFSFWAAGKFASISTVIKQPLLRGVINVLFTVLCIWLIVNNLQSNL